jgi:hypothetical protein
MFNALGKGSPFPGPDEVAMMQDLVKEYCLTKVIGPDSEEGRDVASELFTCFR